MTRPFAVIGLTVFFILAVLSNFGTGVAVIFLSVFTIGLVATCLVRSTREQKTVPVAFASAAVACLMLILTNELYYYPQLTLADDVHSATIKITSEAEENNGKYYTEAVTTSVDGEKTKVRLRLVFSDCPEIEPYDEISGDFTFYTLGEGYDISLKNYKSENRFLGAYSEGTYQVNRIPEGEKGIMYHIVMLRSSIKSRILKLMPNDNGALCLALLLGDSSELSDSAYGRLRNCGVTHVICVSGLHISLWSSAILFLLRKLRIKEKIACSIDIIAVVILMLLTGMTYSVMRAGIMMLIYLLSIIISRQRDSLNSLGFALNVIALTNPFSSGSVSLRLSAVSTLAVICCSEFVMPKMKIREKISGPAKGVFDTVLITCAVVLFNFPITISTFKSFNFLVFPANILVILPAEICMILSVIGISFSALTMKIINIPALGAGIFSKYVLWITEKLSKASFLNFTVSEKYSYIIAAAFLFLAALFTIIYWKNRKHLILSACCCLLVLLTSVPVYGIMQKRETRVTVLDVGDGTAVLVSKNGTNVLIGCGGTTFNSSNEIRYGINDNGGKVEAIILPCGDDDCCSNFADICSYANPDSVYYDSLPVGYGTLTQDKSGGNIPDKITFDDITIENSKINDTNVILISTKDGSFLVCDDPVFDYSVLPENFRNADAIITRSYYPENIYNENLKFIIISGENERGTAVQNELISLGVDAYATAECGDLILRAKNSALEIERG